jgi:hemoglobin
VSDAQAPHNDTETAPPEISFYDRVGGQPFFDRLVDVFYDGIAVDPVLLPLYPDQHDLGPARRRLALFLGQYWGGPTTYNDERGHPRLRMRHMPFRVGPLERDRWLHHMAHAVDAVTSGRDDAIELQQVLLGYFVPAAEHLRNDTGLPISSSDPRR